MGWMYVSELSRSVKGDLPGVLPGEAPQNTQILICLLPLLADLGSVELGLRFESPWGALFSGVAPRAGEAPPDAILICMRDFESGNL
jgi:hypothetical protein